MLVVYVKPWRLYYAVPVAAKGSDMPTIELLANFLQDSNLTTFAYRSDREAAIRALMREATRLSRSEAHDVTDEDPDLFTGDDSDAEPEQPPLPPPSLPPEAPEPDTPPTQQKTDASTTTTRTLTDTKRKKEYDDELRKTMRFLKSGKPMPNNDVACLEDAVPEHVAGVADDVPVAAPERSAPGESASNGLAERAVQSPEGQVRTMNLALQDRLQCEINSDHPSMQWMVMHAAFPRTVCLECADGTTGYENWRGQNARFRMPEFGETIIYFVPAKRRHNLDAKWNFGIFLGRSYVTDQNIIGLKYGTVTRARSIARTTPDKQWQKDRILRMASTPTNEHAEQLDSIESEDAPHAPPVLVEENEEEDEKLARELRRLRITQQDLKRHGYTSHCPKCNMYRLNQIGRAQAFHHTEGCRARMYKLMRVAHEPELLRTDQTGRSVTNAPATSSTSNEPKLDSAADPIEHVAEIGDNNIEFGDVDADAVNPDYVALLDALQILGGGRGERLSFRWQNL